jgi:hypothetical protein
MRTLPQRGALPAPRGKLQTKSTDRRSPVSYFQHFHLHFSMALPDRPQHTSTPLVPTPRGTDIGLRPTVPANLVLRRQASKTGFFPGSIPERGGPMSRERVHPMSARAPLPADARATDHRATAFPRLALQISKSSRIVRRFMSSTGDDQSGWLFKGLAKMQSTIRAEDVTAVPNRARTRAYGEQRFPPLRPEMTAIPRRGHSHTREVPAFVEERSAAPVSHRRTERAVARFAGESSAELVWRRASRKSSEAETLDRGAAGSTDRPATGPPPAGQSTPDVARLVEQAAAKQLTQLDPAVLDRLTDNVISRVEKRIKIERQRQGL